MGVFNRLQYLGEVLKRPPETRKGQWSSPGGSENHLALKSSHVLIVDQWNFIPHVIILPFVIYCTGAFQSR